MFVERLNLKVLGRLVKFWCVEVRNTNIWDLVLVSTWYSTVCTYSYSVENGSGNISCIDSKYFLMQGISKLLTDLLLLTFCCNFLMDVKNLLERWNILQTSSNVLSRDVIFFKGKDSKTPFPLCDPRWIYLTISLLDMYLLAFSIKSFIFHILQWDFQMYFWMEQNKTGICFKILFSI